MKIVEYDYFTNKDQLSRVSISLLSAVTESELSSIFICFLHKLTFLYKCLF